RTGEPMAPKDKANKPTVLPASFSPAQTVMIRYRNFRGQEQTFTADPESAVRKNNHISVRVTPTGHRVTLSRGRIQNLPELDAALAERVAPGQPGPTQRERQVL